MIRKLLLFAAVMLGCLASPAYGLGLGELELKSALNQQFSAEIELTNVRGLDVEEIIPNLGSQEDFDRVGVERNYLLTDLRFKVAPNENGEMTIYVTSSKPVIEPFLNFIVEVLWPTGRILREYTVLLDPPVFGDQAIESVQPSETKSQTNSRPAAAQPIAVALLPASQPVAPSERRPEPQPTTSGRSGSSGDVSGTEYGMTGQGDTLWKIALRVRPNDSVSVQQTMLALQRANPEAFINNNINLLKAGYVLRIPDVREIRAETVASAVQEVRIQNQEFDDYKGGSLAQLDATRRQPSSPASGADPASGELKLLSSDESAGDRSGTGGSEVVQALENELAVAEEDLDRARRANSEMNLKVDDLQGQLNTLSEILTLKDDQLAALKAEVQKMQAASSQPTAQPAPAAQSGSLFSNPLVLGVLGLLLVGAVAGGMILMRRRQQENAINDQFEDSFDEAEEEAEDEAVAELEEAPAIEEEEEDLSPETSDVISEVEIYIAYGRFPQAITFLQNAIQAEPERADIQLKLLEVYVETEDGVAFNLQFDQLRLLGDAAADEAALELQKKIPGAAADAAVAMGATIISMEAVEAIDEAMDDDDDLSFDLDDLGSETEEDDLALGTELDLDDEELDLSLEADDDLELDLEDADATVKLEQSEVEISLEGTDEIELDLDGDLDLDLEHDDEITLDLDDDDEITLDLDDDEISLDLDLDDDLEDDDDDILDLSGLTEEDDLDLEKDLESAALGLDETSTDDDEITLDLDLDDDDLEIDLETAGLDLDDDDEDAISLDLEDDGEITLDLDDDEFSLDLDDEDGLDFDLDDEDDNKLDLARAYIDMGDSEGATSLLQEVLKDGSDLEKQEANQLLEKLD
jgi:pilus assembly protein FimV